MKSAMSNTARSTFTWTSQRLRVGYFDYFYLLYETRLCAFRLSFRLVGSCVFAVRTPQLQKRTTIMKGKGTVSDRVPWSDTVEYSMKFNAVSQEGKTYGHGESPIQDAFEI